MDVALGFLLAAASSQTGIPPECRLWAEQADWPESWLRWPVFVRQWVRVCPGAYSRLSSAMRCDWSIALAALSRKDNKNLLLVPELLRRDEDFWMKAMRRRRLTYKQLPMEWQWDVKLMVQVFTTTSRNLQCQLCTPDRWPWLDNDQLLVNLMWACLALQREFWSLVQPRLVFCGSRKLEVWVVAVRTA